MSRKQFTSVIGHIAMNIDQQSQQRATRNEVNHIIIYNNNIMLVGAGRNHVG